MLIKVRKRSDVGSSEITPLATYLDRRRFLARRPSPAPPRHFLTSSPRVRRRQCRQPKLNDIAKSRYSTDEARTPLDAITRYNNFYEFGSDKEDPARYAAKLKPRPWAVKIDGLCGKPGTYDVDEIIKANRLEERVYRLRCVEAWSMVIPWVGIPVRRRAEQGRAARQRQVRRHADPARSGADAGPTQRRSSNGPTSKACGWTRRCIRWRILAVGLYGEVLPNQNGAPIRLVVPWKYGFKSIKSIVASASSNRCRRPRGTSRRRVNMASTPTSIPTSIIRAGARRRERRIGEFFRRETLPFNGYADEVASLYAGMDLKKWF